MTISRRDFLDFLKATCAAAALPGLTIEAFGRNSRPVLSATSPPSANSAALVNDIHSQLNSTRVDRVIKPRTATDVRATLLTARSEHKCISVAGGRHAMGGQQFGEGTILVDMTSMNRVLDFDAERGIVEVEGGIEWPQLIEHLNKSQEGRDKQWGIVQKQTGADRLTIGGALASNVHGRGLKLKPIIDQVDSFTLMNNTGEILRCSRDQNSELFRLVIGGYGLFGIVTSVKLRLWERKKVQRIVEIRDSSHIIQSFDQRIAAGYLYGDFQFATDSNRDSFLRRGVFSCYRPVDPVTPLTPHPTRFHPEDWARLTYYSHKYKRRAFEVYTRRYLATSGQVYWADSQLSGAYVDNYHEEVDRKLGATVKATEMITEIYVPRHSLLEFLEEARIELRKQEANVIYGTIRLIERDQESFLRWAREPFACVIFNLHVTHDPIGLENAARAFRTLIDLGIRHAGSYYLTYHRFATKQQVEACYPQFDEFLRLKLKYDPGELFQSEWYRHYKRMFGIGEPAAST